MTEPAAADHMFESGVPMPRTDSPFSSWSVPVHLALTSPQLVFYSYNDEGIHQWATHGTDWIYEVSTPAGAQCVFRYAARPRPAERLSLT